MHQKFCMYSKATVVTFLYVFELQELILFLNNKKENLKVICIMQLTLCHFQILLII